MKHRAHIAFALLVAGCGTDPAGSSPGDLFGSDGNALAFASAIDPMFATAKETSNVTLDGLAVERHIFDAGEKIAAVDLHHAADGAILQIDVNFPVVNERCHRAPEAGALARLALEYSEPSLRGEQRNVNLVGSSADIGWRRKSSSSPVAKVGHTYYSFRRLSYFCTMTIERLAVPAQRV